MTDFSASPPLPWKLDWSCNSAKHCLPLTFLLPLSDARQMPFSYCFCNTSCKEREGGTALMLTIALAWQRQLRISFVEYTCWTLAQISDQDFRWQLQPSLSFLQLMIWKAVASQTEQIPSRRHLNLQKD